MDEVITLLDLELFLHKCNWERNKQDEILHKYVSVFNLFIKGD